MLSKHYNNAFVKLHNHYKAWEEAYKKKDLSDAVFGEYVGLFYDYKIPFEYSKSFFDSMLIDCSVARYTTYKQVDDYMYGSAAVV